VPRGAYQCAEGEMHGGPQFGLSGSLTEVLGPGGVIRYLNLSYDFGQEVFTCCESDFRRSRETTNTFVASRQESPLLLGSSLDTTEGQFCSTASCEAKMYFFRSAKISRNPQRSCNPSSKYLRTSSPNPFLENFQIPRLLVQQS